MRIKITGRNIELTEGLKAAVEDKLNKLEKYFTPDTDVYVTLSVEKERQKAEVTIPAKGNYIRSEQVSNDMYVSIDLVEEVIERQLKKYRTKLVTKQQNASAVFKQEFREEFLQKAAAEFPEARTYTYGMELIERENLDAVHICLPSYLHTEHAVAAMKKGMNVLVEKPVCLTREEGELLLETQKETGVKVMVGQVVRAFDEYRYLKEVYDNKTLGKLKSIVMQRVSGNVRWGFEGWFHDEKKSGSVVLDLHIHDLDFLRYMLGEPDDFEVRATTFDSGMINQVITTYEFGDVFATAEGVWDVSPIPKFQAGFRAYFEKGTVYFNQAGQPGLAVYKDDGTEIIPELHPEYEGQTNTGINITNLGPYYTEIKYFLECLQDGKEITLAPLQEGVKSVEQALEEWEAAKLYLREKKEMYI